MKQWSTRLLRITGLYVRLAKRASRRFAASRRIGLRTSLVPRVGRATGASYSGKPLRGLCAPTSLANIPTSHSTHSLPALVFAAQSPYSGCQTFLITAQAVPIQPKRYVQYQQKSCFLRICTKLINNFSAEAYMPNGFLGNRPSNIECVCLTRCSVIISPLIYSKHTRFITHFMRTSPNHYIFNRAISVPIQLTVFAKQWITMPMRIFLLYQTVYTKGRRARIRVTFSHGVKR
jgi:hypothetical protein